MIHSVTPSKDIIATAAFSSNTFARRMYPRSTGIDRWPVWFAMARSEQPRRAAVVTNPEAAKIPIERYSPSQ